MDRFVALGELRGLRIVTKRTASEDLIRGGEFRDLDGTVHYGWLLGDGQGGFEGCWWIAVHDLKSVFQFYPNQILLPSSTGLPLVWGYDFMRTYDQLRDDDVTRTFFADARNPAQLIGLMKMITVTFS